MAKKTKPFNWLTRLRQLAKAKTPHFKPKDFYRLNHRAGHWPTCACGQLCQTLPRLYTGAPEDFISRSHGYAFNTAVARRKWKRALALFIKIEKRTTKLLKAQRLTSVTV